VQDQRFLSAGLGFEVEVLQRLGGGKGCVADALARAGSVAGEDLGLPQGLEELLVGPAFVAGPRAVVSRRSSTRGAFIFESR
jgi:hypothetical protein